MSATETLAQPGSAVQGQGRWVGAGSVTLDPHIRSDWRGPTSCGSCPGQGWEGGPGASTSLACWRGPEVRGLKSGLEQWPGPCTVFLIKTPCLVQSPVLRPGPQLLPLCLLWLKIWSPWGLLASCRGLPCPTLYSHSPPAIFPPAIFPPIIFPPPGPTWFWDGRPHSSFKPRGLSLLPRHPGPVVELPLRVQYLMGTSVSLPWTATILSS
jgi:hypothetical protein